MSASMARLSIPRSGLFGLAAFAALLLAATGHPALAQATAAPNAAQALSVPLKTNTRRVFVDVVVTDAQGRPVTGLTQDDFKVVEDNTPQKLLFFDVHTVTPEANYVAPKIPLLPPNTFFNLAKAPESGTPTVILYDALRSEIGDQLYGHQEILNLLRHRRPGTQIAIFILIDKLHLLQGFTEDTSLLSAALASKKGTPQTTTLLRPSGDIAWTPMADNPPLGNEHDPDEAFNQFVEKAREH